MTVVIPAWGAYVGDLLDRALRSAIAQDLAELRVLVVDNCSEPPIELDVPGVSIIRTSSRLSLGEARNVGLACVTTEYVLFLDADDELVPNAIASMELTLSKCPSVVAVAPQIVDRVTGAPYHWPREWAYWVSGTFPTLFRILEAFRPIFPVNASLIRTAVAQGTPGYGESSESAEDWVFGVSLTLRGQVRLVRVPGIIYQSRAEGQWSRQTSWRSQARHRTEIRRRLYSDPALVPIAKALVPLLLVAHEVDVLRKTRAYSVFKGLFDRGPNEVRAAVGPER